MKCDEIRNKLNAYLDGELENPEEVSSHLDMCADCRRELDELVSVNDFLSQYEEEAVSTRAIENILAIPRRKAFRGLGWFGRFALAASAAAALFLGVITSSEIATSNSSQYNDFTMGTETLYSFDTGVEG